MTRIQRKADQELFDVAARSAVSGAGKETVTCSGSSQDAGWRPIIHSYSNLATTFATCRIRARTHPFIRTMVRAWIAFSNYGLRIEPLDTRIEEAKSTRTSTRLKASRRQVSEYIRRVWHEYYVTENVVSAWADFTDGRPMVLRPELCVYQDLFGLEKLEYSPRVDAGLIEDADLKKRLSKGALNIGEGSAEGFAVYRPYATEGEGFVIPGMYPVLYLLDQWDNFDAGERYFSQFCRTPTRHWKFGHEIKAGPIAGQPFHFFRGGKYDKTVKSLQAAFQNQSGPKDWTSNFDRTFEYLFPDAKHWDRRRWESLYERLAVWGGPLAIILLQASRATAATPAIMQTFQTVTAESRAQIAEYLSTVLSQSLELEATLTWSDQCFQDRRIWSNLLTFGVTSGIVSPQTFNAETGRNDEAELSNLQIAHDQPERRPVYDAAHGTEPAAMGGDKGGRPSNTPDPPPA